MQHQYQYHQYQLHINHSFLYIRELQNQFPIPQLLSSVFLFVLYINQTILDAPISKLYQN
nr:MAG TPA: hypothetical protein [Bacteriophage sp.]